MIKNLIKQIKDAGYSDPTNEDIAFTQNNKKIKFRLYTEEKWNNYLQTKGDASRLATKLGFGEKPDHVVVQDDIVYYVKILK